MGSLIVWFIVMVLFTVLWSITLALIMDAPFAVVLGTIAGWLTAEAVEALYERHDADS